MGFPLFPDTPENFIDVTSKTISTITITNNNKNKHLLGSYQEPGTLYTLSCLIHYANLQYNKLCNMRILIEKN